MTQPPETLPRHELERKLRRSRTLNVILAAVAALGIVFGGVQLFQGTGSSGAPAAEGNGTTAGAGSGADAGAPNVERRIDGDPMAIGDIDAPVVLSEWVDFRCPFCAVFSRDTLPAVVQEYVDSGKVRVEFHDVAFFGEESTRAAAAARAAGEQGRYAEFVSAVYAAAPESGHPDLPKDELVAFAKTAGVADLERFAQDMDKPDHAQAVADSTAQAQQLGVTGVPFFVVDGQAMSGAQPIESFRALLDDSLAAAK
ncbi:thioredoxin domain-containing protein [Leucobacter sp. 7(1)]|uniref:DsbA family protein n=1 Tax=Leucobacter sp. 7(1) TaxID=1255613 RepID=UPI0015963C44|nr:thioredoxin domain-containing protein [Leucobacter sp. 7(1)]